LAENRAAVDPAGRPRNLETSRYRRCIELAAGAARRSLGKQ
jgi:hypothetical protein